MPLSTSDLCIRKASVLLNIPESTVDKLVRFQWAETHAAMREHSTIEVSGFGTFGVRSTVIKRRLKCIEGILNKYYKDLAECVDDTKRKRIEFIINKYLEDKRFILSKIKDEDKGDS